MSRITLHLKKMGQLSYHLSDFTCEVTFSNNVAFYDATTRTRHSSPSDSSTGGTDAGVSYSRAIPLVRLSTIYSLQQSGDGTPLECISSLSDTRNVV